MHFLCALYLIVSVIFWIGITTSPDHKTTGPHVMLWYALPPVIAIVGLLS